MCLYFSLASFFAGIGFKMLYDKIIFEAAMKEIPKLEAIFKEAKDKVEEELTNMRNKL